MGQNGDQGGCGCCLLLYIVAAFSFPILWVPLILVLAVQVWNWLSQPSSADRSNWSGEPMPRTQSTSTGPAAKAGASARQAPVCVVTQTSGETKVDPLTGDPIPPWASYVECTVCGARYSPDSFRFIQEEHQGRCQVCRNVNRYQWHAPSTGGGGTQSQQQPPARPQISWCEQHALETMLQGGAPNAAQQSRAAYRPMTPDEARRLLGVSTNATGYEIRRAYGARIREILDRDPAEVRGDSRAAAQLLDRALWTLLNQEGAS